MELLKIGAIFNAENQKLKIIVKVRNLKEEAKDEDAESGVSDVSDWKLEASSSKMQRNKSSYLWKLLAGKL